MWRSLDENTESISMCAGSICRTAEEKQQREELKTQLAAKAAEASRYVERPLKPFDFFGKRGDQALFLCCYFLALRASTAQLPYITKHHQLCTP